MVVFEYIVWNHLTVKVRQKFKQALWILLQHFYQNSFFLVCSFACCFAIVLWRTHNAILFKFCDLVQILLAFRTIVLEHMYEVNLKMSMAASVTVMWRGFNVKFTVSIDALSDRVFYVTIASTDIGSSNSLHTFLKKYVFHTLVKFEQNQMISKLTQVPTKQFIYFSFSKSVGNNAFKFINPLHSK